MRKLIVVMIVISVAFVVAITRNFCLLANEITVKYTAQTNIVAEKPDGTSKTEEKETIYEVYVGNIFSKAYTTYEEAVAFAETQTRSAVKHKNKSSWIWDNYPPYNVTINNEEYTEFENFFDALVFAKTKQKAFIYYRKDNTLIWSNSDKLKRAYKIEGVPLIKQLPELPRGCEVTSLAMLLQYKGLEVDKMELAEKIKKVPWTYYGNDGKRYFGNPHNGFVGNIRTYAENGLGVYHEPIHDLLTEYFPRSSLDLTGCEFEDLYFFIHNNAPVWVVINLTYAQLPESAFETWNTEEGEIKITYKEHSVLVTGYDENNIYFNDPYGNHTSASKIGFIQCWKQMGSQAITVSR